MLRAALISCALLATTLCSFGGAAEDSTPLTREGLLQMAWDGRNFSNARGTYETSPQQRQRLQAIEKRFSFDVPLAGSGYGASDWKYDPDKEVLSVFLKPLAVGESTFFNVGQRAQDLGRPQRGFGSLYPVLPIWRSAAAAAHGASDVPGGVGSLLDKTIGRTQVNLPGIVGVAFLNMPTDALEEAAKSTFRLDPRTAEMMTHRLAWRFTGTVMGAVEPAASPQRGWLTTAFFVSVGESPYRFTGNGWLVPATLRDVSLVDTASGTVWKAWEPQEAQ